MDPYVSLAELVLGMQFESFVDAFSFKLELTVAEVMIPLLTMEYSCLVQDWQGKKGGEMSDVH